ncbi:hypothetical protein P3342_006741 [Pyrenophora teres f. teres]|nr:hypothetical protein P3342_006741 [Pyrenophora teres f. teres]
MSFKPALVVVDMQEDFDGALAVTGARDIVPTINEFLEYPFALKVATKDYHPRDHVSFASNHTAPNNKPFESTVTIKNPHNPGDAGNAAMARPLHSRYKGCRAAARAAG